MMTDPIADMLTRIRNGLMVRKTSVLVPYSKMKLQLATILSDEGYIGEVKEVKNDAGHPAIQVDLKYVGKDPVIRELKRVSSPGSRVYVGADKLPYVYDNLGTAVISTSKGLMTNKQARSQKIGGEVICEIF